MINILGNMVLTDTVLARLFLRFKPVKIMLSLKKGPRYATQVSKEVDCTYSHTVKLLEDFKKLGLVTFKKQGRIKIIELTQDGEDLAHSIEGVLMKLSRIKEDNEKKKE
jgi:predicted transcriptional regulator